MNNKFLKIIDEIYNYKKEIYQNEAVDLWFRGQTNSDWALESTLHRYTRTVFQKCNWEWNEDKAIAGIRGQFKTLYRKYKAKAWHILPDTEKHEWAIIFSMRHHGIPTTLLDWTESLINAIYFANSGRNPKDDAAIFVLHPPKLNKKSINEEHLIALEEQTKENDKPNLRWFHPHYEQPKDKKLPTIAVTPVLTNRRMIAQISTFIICGDSFDSLEKQYPDCIKKFVLPADTYNASLEYLDCNGITHFGLFPDLHGLKIELDRELEDQIELIIKKEKKL